MKKIYSKLLVFTFLIAGLNSNLSAQWMVGEEVNDTLKYLHYSGLTIDDSLYCYDFGEPELYFAWPMCPDPGIDYGFVMTSNTTNDSVEITPTGYIEVGDTVWLIDDPYWIATNRTIYMHSSDGYITLQFFAVGECTMADIGVPCAPYDSLWMQTLATCNNFFWFDYEACTTVSDPLGIEDLSVEDININYPNRTNDYKLTFDPADVLKATLYDTQGRKVGETLINEINCNDLNTGVYILNLDLKNGQILTEKFMLNK